jgi:hypothetical protein
MTREELDVVLRFWDDSRALIAAGKIQRWEVMKWAVTLNVALATASAGLNTFQIGFVFFSALIALMGIILTNEYNRRMTRARERLRNFNQYLKQNVIDVNAIGQAEFDKKKTPDYDADELRICRSAIVFSIGPSLISWAIV